MSKPRLVHQAPPEEVSRGEAPSGTRSVERALRLLKELSSRGEFGWRLSDLAEQVGLDRATCHRMLACFVGEGFAERGAADLKYYPGQALFELGLAVPQYAALREQVDPRLEQLASRTGCIASFSLRSGNDLVCVYQRRAGLELAGMLIRVGTRRPLITSVGGLAILQQLPADEASRIAAENTQREFGRGGQRRLEKLERMRRRSDQQGYGFSIGDIAPGITAMAVPVRSPAGKAFAALVLTGEEAVLEASVVPGFHALLVQEAAGIEADAARCLRKASGQHKFIP